MQEQINQLRADLEGLKSEYYRNNFTSSQSFQKVSRFNARLKVPHFSSMPATCEIGEIGETGGKLYVCSALNTWVVSGTQS